MPPMLHRLSKTALLLAGPLALVSCAGVGGTSVQVVAQASDTPNFSLSRPAVYKTTGGLQVAGRVCRRARTTLLSPSQVRLEHLSAAGEITETAKAGVGEISRRADQPCSNYSGRVSWTLAEGDTVRVCFDRGRACPSAPTVTTVIAAPTSPASPP